MDLSILEEGKETRAFPGVSGAGDALQVVLLGGLGAREHLGFLHVLRGARRKMHAGRRAALVRSGACLVAASCAIGLVGLLRA